MYDIITPIYRNIPTKTGDSDCMKITAMELNFATLMSLVTTFFVTLVLVSVNLGFTNEFLYVWLRSWLIAFVLVGLSILFIAPQIKRFLNRK